MIHDYFVKHSLDLVRDGGQVSIISSIGTMDKRTDNVLQEIKSSTHFFRGEFGCQIRLLKKIAGTRVTTDLLFFQKDQAKNLNEEELVLVVLFSLRRISVSGSILILMGNTTHKFWVNMRYVIFNGGTPQC